MHFGLVDSYNGLKRRSLERTIFVSGGLRSRYPPNHGRGKLTGPKPKDSEIFVCLLSEHLLFKSLAGHINRLVVSHPIV